MKTTLINTLHLTSGEIFMIVSGRRTKLSGCKVDVELYEQKQKIPTLGGNGVKKRKISIVICDDVDLSDCDFNKISRFEVFAEIRREDGIYERIHFYDLAMEEIEEHGKWKFEVMSHEQINKLFKLVP